jgi:hypothetical protein
MNYLYYLKCTTIVVSLSVSSLSAMHYASVLKDTLFDKETAKTIVATASVMGVLEFSYSALWYKIDNVQSDKPHTPFTADVPKIVKCTLQTTIGCGIPLGVICSLLMRSGSWPQIHSSFQTVQPFLVSLGIAAIPALYLSCTYKNEGLKANNYVIKPTVFFGRMLRYVPYGILSASCLTAFQRYRMSTAA